jgi:alanyl-tRNA synthetase
VLGDHVKQAGSAVRPDKLRFDFTHPSPLTPAERERVEELVNDWVFQNHPVRPFETPIDEARKLGAMMLFGEKYGDIVRVVEVDGVSRELCGGTHVRSTAEIGPFVILSESSVGSGARRIEAVTAGEGWALLRERAREADDLRAELDQVRKEAKRRPAAAADSGPEVDITFEGEAGGANVVVGQVRSGDLLEVGDRLKQQRRPAAVALGQAEDGKVALVVMVDPSLEDRVNAVEVVREAAAHVGGGGGGRPSMARAGGKDPAKLPEALEAARGAIVARLS